jgi:hypothetical protein
MSRNSSRKSANIQSYLSRGSSKSGRGTSKKGTRLILMDSEAKFRKSSMEL